MNDQIYLSVIVVVFNMQRAAPRSIASLLEPYQQAVSGGAVEVLVVENGSSKPLNEAKICSMGKNIRYINISDASPSPAASINYAAGLARGEVLCIMVDGAHMLTPALLSYGCDLFAAMPNPIVFAPQFFLGPGPQTETVFDGYDECAEDKLIESIDWPNGDGYRLFEIGVPYRIEPAGKRPKLYWFVRMFESNCLFARRSIFDDVGGCDERFDIPGGGFLIPDLCKRLSEYQGATIVQLMGEASFHQVHGGTSTNTSVDRQKEKLAQYSQQYLEIYGQAYEVSKQPIRFYGHMPNRAARQLMITG